MFLHQWYSWTSISDPSPLNIIETSNSAFPLQCLQHKNYRNWLQGVNTGTSGTIASHHACEASRSTTDGTAGSCFHIEHNGVQVVGAPLRGNCANTGTDSEFPSQNNDSHTTHFKMCFRLPLCFLRGETHLMSFSCISFRTTSTHTCKSLENTSRSSMKRYSNSLNYWHPSLIWAEINILNEFHKQ